MVFNRPGDHLAATSNPAPGSRRPARMLRGNHPALVAAGHRCPVRAGGADRRTPPTQRGPPGRRSPPTANQSDGGRGYDNGPEPTGDRGEAIVRTDARQVGHGGGCGSYVAW